MQYLSEKQQSIICTLMALFTENCLQVVENELGVGLVMSEAKKIKVCIFNSLITFVLIDICHWILEKNIYTWGKPSEKVLHLSDFPFLGPQNKKKLYGHFFSDPTPSPYGDKCKTFFSWKASLYPLFNILMHFLISLRYRGAVTSF